MSTKTKKDMEETTEMGKAKAIWDNVKKILVELESEMSILGTKREERSLQLKDNEKMITAADDERRTAARSLALGHITEERYTAMKKDHWQAQQDKVDIGYMLESLDEEIGLIGRKISEQRIVVMSAEKFYWSCVSSDLVAQIQEHAALFGKAYLTYRMTSSGSKDFGEFVAQCVFPELRHANSDNSVYGQLRSEIIADYAGK